MPDLAMRKRPWLRGAVAAVLALLVVNAGFSWVLRDARVHGYLNARLEAAFGRPVVVSHFNFSLLDGPRLEADSVTVAEDPRFGHEYFLRAERLTAGLRWPSLVRGRFEFGTLSFTRPSLNLVRAADGHWNLESWLPPPAPAAGTAPPAKVSSRLYRIEVDAGRINFKRGLDKHPFALVDVKGHLEQESPGRWRIDLEARPVRAAVALQEAGTLRVRGRIAGTSARLQPAELVVTWQGASLADALRLGRGSDYGVRGRLAVELTARSERSSPRVSPVASPGVARANPGGGNTSELGGTRWLFAGIARLGELHRWDLPQRPRDPAVNLSVEGEWRPGVAGVEFSKCALEAPRSSVHATGRIRWAPTFDPEFRFVSSGISLGDLLAWYRAFRPGVAEGLTLDGNAATEFVLAGWPPRLEQGSLAINGAQLRTASLREPIRVGYVAARVQRGRLELEPTTIMLATGSPGGAGGSTRPGNLLRMEGTIGPGKDFPRAQSRDWKFDLSLVGQTDRVQDLLLTAQALGHPLYRGWSMEGPVSLHLRWQGSLRPFAAQPLGSIELRGLRVQASYLNQPVNLVNARIELRPGERRVTLSLAQGFGAQWRGSLRKSLAQSSDAAQPWEFDLTADRLNAAELDRWLGPRARPSLLQRMVPFAATNRSSSEFDAVLSSLQVRGRLRVDEVVFSPLSLPGFRAEAEIKGRNIILRNVQAEFYGGRVKGTLDAQLSAEPVYHFQAQFERVNLSSLADATATLKDRFSGLASGELECVARGVGRENLLRSLRGRGTLQVRSAEMRGLDLRATYLQDAIRPGTSQFAAADVRFSLAAGNVQVETLRLSDRGDDFEAEGSVDFSRTLDFRIRLLARPEGKRPRDTLSRTIRITGPLDAPRIARLEPQG
jgi:hypothetical protein